jgi:prevent-host-death family protein
MVAVKVQTMQVPLSIARAKLCELVRRAEAGEKIVLTERGRPVAQLEPVGTRESSHEAFNPA